MYAAYEHPGQLLGRLLVRKRPVILPQPYETVLRTNLKISVDCLRPFISKTEAPKKLA